MKKVSSGISFNEFFGIEFPQQLQQLGFVDQSWHNDACAYCNNIALKLGVWCDYEKPEDREMQNKQYLLVTTDDEGNSDSDVIQTDDITELVAKIKYRVTENNIKIYSIALENARVMIDNDETKTLGLRSALKQCAANEGIHYGDEMGDFVHWAEKELGIA